jgi:hypothetical protein
MADLPVRESFSPRHALTFDLTEAGLAPAPDQTVTAEADQREEAGLLTIVSRPAKPAPAPSPAAPIAPPAPASDKE